MKNIVNFFNLKREFDDQNCKKYYRTGEFYKYEISIQEKLKELNKLKEESNDMLYQIEIFNILIKFYNAAFNICDKLAIEIHNGIFTNKDGFLVFFDFLSNIYLNMIDLTKQKELNIKRDEMVKISDNFNKELKPTVNEYVKIRDSIDSYIEDLTEISNKTSDEKVIDFSVEEQYNILTIIYEKILNIAKKYKEELENGIGTNTGTMYFIMMELEKIVTDLPDTNKFKKVNNLKVIKYKKEINNEDN